MGRLTAIIGYGWAALGVWIFMNDTNWSIVLSDSATEAEKYAAVSDMGGAIMLMMVIPGLALAAISRKSSRQGHETRT